MAVTVESERTVEFAPPTTAEQYAPLAPASPEETGLSQALIADLALKLLYQRGPMTATDLSTALCLPMGRILQPVLDFLKAEHQLEVKGGSGLTSSSFFYSLATKGIDRAKEALARNGLRRPGARSRSRRTRIASARRRPVTCTSGSTSSARRSERSCSRSARSGSSARRSTAAARSSSSGLPAPASRRSRRRSRRSSRAASGRAVRDPRWPADHPRLRPVAAPVRSSRSTRASTAAGSRSPRPFVRSAASSRSRTSTSRSTRRRKVHEAPFQMKANGGVLLIDDFGRQRVSPERCSSTGGSSRSIATSTSSPCRRPEDRGPVRPLLVFSTNRTPSSLVDEAFLRRIQYKIEVSRRRRRSSPRSCVASASRRNRVLPAGCRVDRAVLRASATSRSARATRAT